MSTEDEMKRERVIKERWKMEEVLKDHHGEPPVVQVTQEPTDERIRGGLLLRYEYFPSSAHLATCHRCSVRPQGMSYAEKQAPHPYKIRLATIYSTAQVTETNPPHIKGFWRYVRRYSSSTPSR